MSAVACPVPAPEHVVAGYGYGFGTTLTVPFSAAVERVVTALQAEGFGLLMDVAH
jgi:hypothetical protein